MGYVLKITLGTTHNINFQKTKIYIKKSLLKTFLKPNFWKKSKFYFQSSAKKYIYANRFSKKDLEMIIFLQWTYKENLVFLKIYLIGSTQVDLLNIRKYAALKICIWARLEKLVWSTLFAECDVIFRRVFLKSRSFSYMTFFYIPLAVLHPKSFYPVIFKSRILE